MGLREGSGMLCIASMHRFRVTRGAKWALSRGADETVCILLQGDEEEEERLRGRQGGLWVGRTRQATWGPEADISTVSCLQE